MKAYIPNRNLLTWTQGTVEWLLKHSITPIILDNASTYPPLLEWYKTSPCEILKLGRNLGHTCFWWTGMAQMQTQPFIYTDPDLDYTGIPPDFQDRLLAALDKYPNISKAGFNLEINDLPEANRNKVWCHGCTIEQHEGKWWAKKHEGVWLSNIDTTFALYRAPCPNFNTSAIRLDRPYTVRHLPWYLDYTNLDSEYAYYVANGSHRESTSIRFSLQFPKGVTGECPA